MHFSVGFISLRFEKFRLAGVGRIDFEINIDTILLIISGVSRNIPSIGFINIMNSIS